MYEIRAAMPPWDDTVDLLILERLWHQGGEQRRRAVTSMVVSDVAPGDYLQPTLKLQRDMAQQLMDNLWQCGLRPTEGTGSAGALAATQKHLDDMRMLVFKPPTISGDGQ